MAKQPYKFVYEIIIWAESDEEAWEELDYGLQGDIYRNVLNASDWLMDEVYPADVKERK